jgi:hypothetical protein
LVDLVELPGHDDDPGHGLVDRVQHGADFLEGLGGDAQQGLVHGGVTGGKLR